MVPSACILCIGMLKFDTPELKNTLLFGPGLGTMSQTRKRAPSGQAAANAAPSQEGLFDRRQRWNTRKQWNKECQRVSEMLRNRLKLIRNNYKNLV